MTDMNRNPVNWFEIATSDPERAKRFYGDLFGWTYTADPGDPTGGYDIVDCGPDAPIQGGITSRGEMPSYAIACVMVGDVAATCSKVEKLGGTIVVEPQKVPTGLVFAHIRDADGNQLGVYSPPPAA